jgi:hypothetical protein
VIQPGGSMRDDEVIAAAADAGLALVFTGKALGRRRPLMTQTRHLTVCMFG